MSDTGIVLDQHFLNPSSLGIDHFETLGGAPLGACSALLFDVKDINGFVYLPTKSKLFGSQVRSEYGSFFRQVELVAKEASLQLYLGVPGLHDASIDGGDWFVVDNEGNQMKGRICPNQPEYLSLLGDFLEEVTDRNPDGTIFLPFFRYLPLEKNKTCFCERCDSAYRKRFSRDLRYSKFVSDASVFAEWIDWRCQLLTDAVQYLKQRIAPTARLAIEIDVDPARLFEPGLRLVGQNIEALGSVVDEFVCHLYDRTPMPNDLSSGSDSRWSSAQLLFASLASYKADFSLFFWGVDSKESLERRFEIAAHLNPRVTFFLVGPRNVNHLKEHFA